MIYKLAPHIHFQGHDANIKNPNMKEVLDFFSDYDIITLAVHSTEVTEKYYSSFVKECEKHSMPNKLIIPCLEDESKSYHLLLIGAPSYTNDVFNPDREHITILAHPWGYGYHERKIRKENLNLEELNGIEVWNFYHNSKKYPSLKSLKFLKSLNGRIKAHIGLDTHPPFHKQDAVTFVNCKNLKKDSVIKALKEGAFYHQIKDITISSQGELKKNRKTIDSYTKMRCLIHEHSIHGLSLLVENGKKTQNLLGIKEKKVIKKFVKQLRRNL